jgi:hypothetical protein
VLMPPREAAGLFGQQTLPAAASARTAQHGLRVTALAVVFVPWLLWGCGSNLQSQGRADVKTLGCKFDQPGRACQRLWGHGRSFKAC